MSEPSPAPEAPTELSGQRAQIAAPLPTAAQLDELEADLERIDAVLDQLDQDP